MLNIEISVDFENVINSDEFFEINNVSDYVEGYKKIQESIYNEESLSVVLRNKFCLRAFKKMQELYGKDKIKIKHYNYRQKLEHELQFKIPESILDSELKNYKLLNNIDDYKLDKYNNFTNFLLGNILNEYFGNKEFPIINILDFYDKINFDLIEKRKDDELFKKIFKEKIDKWKEMISGELKQKTFNFFLSEPKTFYKNLATYNLIYKYPRSVKEKIIKDRYLFLEKLNFKKDNKIRKNVNEKQVKKILKEYLNKTKKNKMLEHKESLNFLSGNFKIELDFILDVLESQKKLQKKEIIDEIKYKFTDIMNSEYLNRLNRLIRPEFPSSPKKNKTVSDWLKWITTEYLDYRFWAEENNIENEKIDKYAFLYSEWLFNNYINLLSEDNNMMHKVITSKIGEELKNNKTSIILILDNFNFKYVNLLKELFEEKKLITRKEEPVISLIPTVTNINKGTLLSMNPYNINQKPNYPKLCKHIGEMYEKKSKYISSIRDLENLKIKENHIYVINHLRIDKILHENGNNSATSLFTRIKNELKGIVELIDTFIESSSIGSEATIYVISDHGSVKIPKERLNFIPCNNESIVDDGHRAAKILDKNLSNYKKKNNNFYYVLEKNKFGTPTNYLIAKEYNRFKETNDSFYVHGGLTPEESIVPFLKFRKEREKFDFPDLILQNNELSDLENAKLYFTIHNNNEFLIENIKIKSSDEGFAIKDAFITKVEGLSSKEIIIQIINDIKLFEDEIELSINIKFDYLGNSYSKVFNYSVKISNIKNKDVNLNNLFD